MQSVAYMIWWIQVVECLRDDIFDASDKRSEVLYSGKIWTEDNCMVVKEPYIADHIQGTIDAREEVNHEQATNTDDEVSGRRIDTGPKSATNWARQWNHFKWKVSVGTKRQHRLLEEMIQYRM